MAKVSLAKNMREQLRPGHGSEKIGPFVTISRQYGCYGFSLGMLLQEILNESLPPSRTWKVYGKYILEKLAGETRLAADILERERMARPHLLVEFFRGLSENRIPSGHEVRSRITTILRSLAISGRTILVGQGGAAVTADLPNGLSVRLEAPEEWRIHQIAFREGVSEAEAGKLIRAKEEEREYLRELYVREFPRTPAFQITYDCSAFTLAQVARQVTLAMQQRGMINKQLGAAGPSVL